MGEYLARTARRIDDEAIGAIHGHGYCITVVQSGNNTYADHNGNVYKEDGSGWQKNDKWKVENAKK